LRSEFAGELLPYRRTANPPFPAVATLARISLPRGSQIQGEIQQGKPDQQLKSLVDDCKLKA
jgi:hypothetical protein